MKLSFTVNFSSSSARMNQAVVHAHAPDPPWLEGVAFGLLLCDPNLKALRANARCADLLGVAADTLPGQTLLTLLQLPERQHELVAQALRQRRPWQGLARSGERALKVEVRRTDEGVVASLIDYSADLEHLQRLTEAKTLAEKANAEKSRFLQHMTHELRTPLNAIIGFTQLLKLAQGLDARELDNVAEIEKAGTSLLALINGILDLSRIESGKLKLTEAEVDLRDLSDECLQLLAPLAAQRGIHVEMRIDGAGALLADYMRLKQILLNLLSNAIRYNRDGGQVRLVARALDDDCIRIEIHDTGIGIAPEHLDTIFSPFDRIGSIAGSGIGLLISRRLVTLMQGRIGASSVPGEGSVFWIELPAKRLSALESMLRQADGAESAKAGAASSRNEAQREADGSSHRPAP